MSMLAVIGLGHGCLPLVVGAHVIAAAAVSRHGCAGLGVFIDPKASVSQGAGMNCWRL